MIMRCLNLNSTLLLVLTMSLSFRARAARFSVESPVVTVTLKEPAVAVPEPKVPWLSMDRIRPTAVWTLRSTSKPLPNWLPSLQSLRANLGYRFDDVKDRPSHASADFTFANDHGALQVQPTYHVKDRRLDLNVQVSRGSSYVLAKFASRKDRLWSMIKASYTADRVPHPAVGALRITPTYDFGRNEPSCLLEGITSSQRTKAVLNLEYNHPTLTVVHALDKRNVIAPEISLYDAKIVYNWNVALESGAMRTKVDPTSSIHINWVDRSMTGQWITDVRLPLEGTTVKALAADIKVRRQFMF